MAGAIGFNFTIGARMASSVASVFNTVSARAGNLRGELRTLSAMSRASGALVRTQTQVADLRAQAAAGRDVRTQLAAAETALAAARRQAARYNISMEDAARIHARTTAQIQRTENALRRQQTLMRNSARRSELQGEIMGAMASAGMVIAPVKLAIDFESSMADAAKTIDGMRDEAGTLTSEYYKMESAVKSLGRELPLTHTEIASLFAAGGQMGMTTAAQLTEFSTLAAHMSVAFSMGTDAAADAIGGYKTKLGLTNEQVREMLDLTNQFANTSSATEKDIAGIVSRVGALGDMAGIAYRPMTAMAATLASMKVPEEIAATGLKNFMLALSKGDAATKTQQEAFARIGVDSKKLAVEMQADAEGAMLAVLEKVKALPKHEQTAILTQLFGTESVGAIAPMLTQLDLLRKNFVMSGDTAEYAGAMQKEFENRSKTTANNLIILKNKASEVAITMGGALLPGINDVVSAMGSGAMVMAAFTEANPAVVKAVMYTVTALVAFKVASMAGGFGMTLFSDALVYGNKAWSLATLMCQRSTYAMIWQETVAKAVAIKTKALALATRGLAGAQAVFTALTSRATYAMIAQKAVSLAMAAGTTLMTVAQWGLNVAMTANPVGLIVVGVAALCAGLYALYKYCEPVRTAMTGLWDGIKTAMEPVAEKIGWVFEKLDFIRSMGGKAGMKLRAYLGLDEENAKADTPAPETIKTSMESGPAAKEAMASPETQAYITPESDPTHPANTTDPDVSEADMQQMLEDALKGTTGQYQVNIPAETQSSPAGAAMKPMPSVPAAMDRPRRQQSPPAHLPHAGSEGVPGMSDADMQQMLEDTRRSAPAQGRRVDTDRLIASVKTPAAGPASTASRQSAAIHPSLNLTVQLHGVSDRDFGDRVLGAVVDKKSEFERFLGGLMKNASRVAYE